jgi:tartrate-resistant acid phosphatase type 5
VADYHLEEYLHLAGLTHKSAVIAWGGFFFRVRDHGAHFKLVDDGDLDHVFPPRDETIGERSRSYGPAMVRLYDAESGELCQTVETSDRNHVELTELRSDTVYRYEVLVNGQPWAEGERRDWGFDAEGRAGLVHAGGRYDNRFRTLPHPTEPAAISFAVIGDFGTGVRKPSKPNSRQREVAEALRTAADTEGLQLILTTGDNIYAQRKLLGLAVGGQGDEDDDWFFTFYQPYRYVINRVPVFPSVGNHDSGETEFVNDDRVQVYDNFYIATRFAAEAAAGRASLSPGLFYRVRCGRDVEFIALDSSKASIVAGHRFFMDPAHRAFLDQAFLVPEELDAPAWRIPFFHHPPYTAGPNHNNSASVLTSLVAPYFVPGGVRVAFAGHEHNFQHTESDGIHVFVTGGAGKVAMERPRRSRFDTGRVRAWAGSAHFLLGRIDGDQLTLRPIGPTAEVLTDIPLEDPDGGAVPTPLRITRGAAD